jgi:hypothetical protein
VRRLHRSPVHAYAPLVTTTSATGATSAERECLRAAGTLALGGAAVVVLLWAASFPGWPVAAGVVLSLLVVAGVMVIMGAEPSPAARWLRPAGLLGALLLAVVGGILVERTADAALHARFERSRSAFEAVAAQAGPVSQTVTDRWGPFPGDCPDQLGSYRITECHAFAGGFMFLQKRGALGNDAGFAYLPDGLENAANDQNGLPASGFTHLDGPWYAWSCGC